MWNPRQKKQLNVLKPETIKMLRSSLSLSLSLKQLRCSDHLSLNQKMQGSEHELAHSNQQYENIKVLQTIDATLGIS